MAAIITGKIPKREKKLHERVTVPRAAAVIVGGSAHARKRAA